jgi:hypothetical protein
MRFKTRWTLFDISSNRLIYQKSDSVDDVAPMEYGQLSSGCSGKKIQFPLSFWMKFRYRLKIKLYCHEGLAHKVFSPLNGAQVIPCETHPFRRIGQRNRPPNAYRICTLRILRHAIGGANSNGVLLWDNSILSFNFICKFDKMTLIVPPNHNEQSATVYHWKQRPTNNANSVFNRVESYTFTSNSGEVMICSTFHKICIENTRERVIFCRRSKWQQKQSAFCYYLKTSVLYYSLSKIIHPWAVGLCYE